MPTAPSSPEASPAIVAAPPTHGAAAAELVYQTDPGVWDYLFRNQRTPFDRFAGTLWALPRNSFSHSESVLIADAEGSPAALEMGYPGTREPGLRAAMRAAVMGFMPEPELVPLLEQAQDIDYLAPYIPEDAYYVHFLSVRPNAQGRGLGGRLLEHAFERARAAGCTSVHLDVYSGNPAVTLYQRYGFRIVVETRFPGKTGLPPHFRMVRDL